MRRLLSPQGRAPVWMLALRDLIHDWRLTLVAVMTVTVALAPTILLFGLKLGVVDAMRDRLARNPANLEIRLLAGAENGLEPEFFARIAALPQTGFLAPMTRENGPPLVLLNQAAMDSDAVEVSLYPSAEGDPLLAAAGVAPPTGEGIVLSEPVAKALLVQPGEKLISILRRIDGANSETVNPELTVTGVLPRTLTERSAIWVAQDFLIAVEDYRDWREVARYGWTGAQSVKDLFVSFRLYARSMDDVAPLVDHLEAEEHLSVRSAANAIAHVKRIDADLTLRLAREHEALITIEEGAVGGFGSHVMQLLSDEGALDHGLRLRSMVFPDTFLDQDSPAKMYETAGMQAPDIVARALAALGREQVAADARA